MMKVKSEFIKSYLDWKKFDILGTLFLLLIPVILLQFFVIPEEFKATVILVMGIVAFAQFWGTSLLGTTSGHNKFSWKFYQGLPFSKEELAQSLIVTRLFSVIPLLFFLVVYYPHLASLFKELDASLLITLVNLVIVAALVEVISIGNNQNAPRVKFQSENLPSNNLLVFIRNVLQFLTILIILFILLGLAQTYFSMNLFSKIGFVFKGIFSFLIKWSTFSLLGFLFYSYSNLIRNWSNEKQFYKRPVKLNPYKEWGIIVGCMVFLGVVGSQIDTKTPGFYRENSLGIFIYKKDYDQMEKISKGHPELLKPNSFGFTPMLMAIHMGDIRMIKILENAGADFRGALNARDANHKNFNALMLAADSDSPETLDYILSKGFKINELNKDIGFSVTHYAASRCKAKMLDHILSLKADINLRNDKGETPALVGARFKCLQALVSLKEAGADFSLSDTKGNKIANYMGKEKYDANFNYYLEKLNRMPASPQVK